MKKTKLWVALGAAVLIIGMTLGGVALGVSEEERAEIVGRIWGLALALMGLHAWSDVNAMRNGK